MDNTTIGTTLENSTVVTTNTEENESITDAVKAQYHLSRVHDKDYENEFSYTLIRLLRGNTPGRRIKRSLFKVGIVQLACGAALTVIAYLADENFSDTPYFDNPKYFAALQTLMWIVSIPGFIMGITSWLAVRFWGSLVTNRTLCATLLKVYLLFLCILCVFTWYMIAVLVLTFERVTDWGTSITLAQIRPYYISMMIFVCPLSAADMFYIYSIGKIVEDVENEGIIAEPNTDPDDVMDLSDVTFGQSVVLFFSLPCIIMIQAVDGVGVFYRHYLRWCVARQNAPKKKSTVWRFFKRCFRNYITGRKVRPDWSEHPRYKTWNEDDLEVLDWPIDREEQERETRQRLQKEMADLKYIEKKHHHHPGGQIMRLSPLDGEHTQTAVGMKTQLFLAAVKGDSDLVATLLDAGADEDYQEAKNQHTDDFNEAKYEVYKLDVEQFKALWFHLDVAQSFTTKLKRLPPRTDVIAHLEMRGFVVVYVTSPTAEDFEIGLCNAQHKRHNHDKWFLARFLATKSTFSAVMKAQDHSVVTEVIKRFQLKKVLDIDIAV